MNASLAALCLPVLLTGCWISGSVSETPRRASGPAESQASAPELPSIVQARVSTGEKGKAPTGFVDYEISGPASLALPTCEALVNQELRASSDASPSVLLVRKCDVVTMLEPAADSSFALVRVSRMGPNELRVSLGESFHQKLDGLRVRRRVLQGYSDQESCEKERKRLQDEQDTVLRAHASTTIDQQISVQEKATQEVCAKKAKGRGDGKSDDCMNSESALGMLKERRTHVQNSAEAPLGSSMVCRKR